MSAKQAAVVAEPSLKVVENALESEPETAEPILAEDPAESETPSGRADTRQPIEVSAPKGFVKADAIAYHFAETVPAETIESIMAGTAQKFAELVEGAGLLLKAVDHKYHTSLRIGTEAELAKAPAKSSGPREKVLTGESYKTFENAQTKLTAELIKSGKFDKANRVAAAREARDTLLTEWNATKDTLREAMSAYQASLLD